MNSKADSNSRKSSLTDSSQLEPGKLSRLSSKPDQPADASSVDWSVLQLLRRNLKLMSEPFPASVKQLLQLEKKFQELDVKPKVMIIEGLEQSDTLRQNVKTFPFTEEDLMQEAEANARRQADEVGKLPATAGNRKTDPVAKVAKTNEKLSERVRSQSTSNNSVANSVTNKTEACPELDKITAAEIFDRDFLTPDFMQQWINEIISVDSRENNTASKKGQSIQADKKNSSVDSKRVDSIKHRSAKLKNFPDNKHAPFNSVKMKSVEGYLSSKKANPDSAKTGAPLTTPLVKVKQVTLATEQIHALQRNAIPELFPVAAPEPPKTAFEGVALLQQLVQVEKFTAASNSVRRKKAEITAKENTAGADKGGLANNTAWQQLEKSLRFSSSASRANAESTIAPLPVPEDTGLQNFVYQDESERIAALVNEALVEQAIRYGVDLS